MTQSQRALTTAQQQYSAGLTDFLQVLTAERTLLQAQQQQAQSTTTVSTDLVALYKALGGGWENTYPRAEAANAQPITAAAAPVQKVVATDR